MLLAGRKVHIGNSRINVSKEFVVRNRDGSLLSGEGSSRWKVRPHMANTEYRFSSYVPGIGVKFHAGFDQRFLRGLTCSTIRTSSMGDSRLRVVRIASR